MSKLIVYETKRTEVAAGSQVNLVYVAEDGERTNVGDFLYKIAVELGLAAGAVRYGGAVNANVEIWEKLAERGKMMAEGLGAKDR